MQTKFSDFTKSSLKKIYTSNFVTGITEEQADNLRKTYQNLEPCYKRLQVLTTLSDQGEIICRYLLLPVEVDTFIALLDNTLNKRKYLKDLLGCNISQVHSCWCLSCNIRYIVLAISANSAKEAADNIKLCQRQQKVDWMSIRNSGLLRLIKPKEGYKASDQVRNKESVKSQLKGLDVSSLVLAFVLVILTFAILVHFVYSCFTGITILTLVELVYIVTFLKCMER